LCDDCKKHYDSVIKYLDNSGIKYVEDDYLVRGLDYYTRTTFEFRSEGLGGQDTLIAGGRYDYLTKEIGGMERGAVGFAGGIERMFLLKRKMFKTSFNKIFVVYQSEKEREYAFYVLSEIRKTRKYIVDWLPVGGKIQKQLRRANKYGFDYAVIIGENEVKADKISLKDLRNGNQRLVDLKELLAL